jgi:hypothetical protein
MHRHAGSGRPHGFRVFAIDRPQAEGYAITQRTELHEAVGQAIVGANRTATVSLGPQGWGTRWFLTQANVSTTTGVNDVASTVSLYLGSQVQANLLGGGTYSGGQDTIGLNTRPLQPGDIINAVWQNATPGDTATIVLYGQTDVLTQW